jgi:hypothetical protein
MVGCIPTSDFALNGMGYPGTFGDGGGHAEPSPGLSIGIIIMLYQPRGDAEGRLETEAVKYAL